MLPPMTLSRASPDTSAVIAGASAGLGMPFAEAFAARGQPLILVARSSEKVAALAVDLRGRFEVECARVTVDLAAVGAADRSLDATAGRVESTPANNAGVAVAGAFVNVASRAGLQPVPFVAARKAYLPHVSGALREELRGTGVRVLAICPGATDAGFWPVATMNPADTRFELQSPKLVVVDDDADDAMRASDRDRSSTIPGPTNDLGAFAGRLASRDAVTVIVRKRVGR